MPRDFPLSVAENSGNMIHARAPFEMFPNAVGTDFGYSREGYRSFIEFVNERCSHLIVTLANTFRLGDPSGERYARLVRQLEQVKVPLVIFGLGAQAKDEASGVAALPSEGVELIRFLADRAAAVSVRGEFSYSLFERHAGTDRVTVTGCPSYFSRPAAFDTLRAQLDRNDEFGSIAYSGTAHHSDVEKPLLYRAVSNDHYLVEPVNKFNHAFYVAASRGDAAPEVPWFFKGLLASEPGWSAERLATYFARRYRLFRNVESWYDFVTESIDGALGSRFHANMATMLAGRPAVWFTHDSRTRELCRVLGLPSVEIEDVQERPFEEILAGADWDPLFSGLAERFSVFNGFLDEAGLPRVRTPQLLRSR